MNAIAPRNAAGTAVASLQALKQGLQNVQSTIVTAGGDPFLRLLKDGFWVYGQDNLEVEQGSLWAVNTMSLKHGFVSWTRHDRGADEVVGEVMVPMTSGLPAQDELHDTGWDWKQQISVVMQCLTGADVGTQVLYKATAVGGLSELKELIGAIMAQLDRDALKPIPVIELQTATYQHKKWGKVYTPVFSVQRWMSLEGVELQDEPIDATPPPEPAAAPARTRTRRTAAETPPAAQPPSNVGAAVGKPIDQMTVEELEAFILAKKTPPAADPAEAKRAALLAQLAELDGAGTQAAPQATGQAEAPAAGQTLRRRRNS